MKRVIILCEGETEQEFCQKTLQSHFAPKNVSIQPPIIKKTGGGLAHWSNIRKQLVNHLRENNNLVTMLIDFYGIEPKHEFPKWAESLNIQDKNERIDFLEKAIFEDLGKVPNFLPYLQLHEWEALLFVNTLFFEQTFGADIQNIDFLKETLAKNPNPETINDQKDTCPSARLAQCIIGYDKIVCGNILIENIGLETVRTKNPRFNQWIQKIEKI